MADVIRSTYDARSGLYDAIVRALSFGGDTSYRRAAVDDLELQPGQRVLDVGCGTGLNFRWIAERLGPAGRMVGSDLSLGMLSRVRPRPNLRLVQAAARQDVFRPGSFDAILSTYVISTILDEELLAPLLRALKPGGRLVIADDNLPPGWYIGPGFMFSRMWRSGWPDLKARTVAALRPHLDGLRVRHFHYGMIFVISGTKRA